MEWEWVCAVRDIEKNAWGLNWVPDYVCNLDARNCSPARQSRQLPRPLSDTEQMFRFRKVKTSPFSQIYGKILQVQ
jgi:hypothetical protein